MALTDLDHAASLTSVRRDIASIHHLRCGPFFFKSQPVPDASNLSIFVLLPSRGEICLNYMKNSSVVGPGDVMVVSNWTPFHLSATALDAIVLTVPAWWGFQKIIGSGQTRREQFLSRDSFCAPTVHFLVRSMFEQDMSRLDGAKSTAIMAEMLRIALEATPGEEDWLSSPGGRFGRILQFVAQQLEAEDLSPQAAAKALKCSVRTIHKTCADHGTSFNNMIMEIRLSSATYLLSTTNNRISDIAYASGFGSLSHFCRLFKARLGESATEYRKRYTHAGARPGGNPDLELT
jgi:AraC-like DNA-binding protein